MNHRTRWTLLLALVLLALAACTAAPQASAPTADPAAFARRLATVDLPPTPDDGQRRATQIAALPTATFRAPTLGITPTIYVGTFVGAEADEPSLPVVDPAQFLGTLGAPTEVAPELAACSVPADPTFGTVWPEQPGLADQLGCAAEAAVNSEGSSQVFERGLMAFVPSGEIWALQPGTAYWHTTQAPADRPWDQPAPDGLRVPSLGFGAFWKANSSLRDGLGYARTDESGSAITTQRFERGLLLRNGASGASFVLIGEPDAGVVYGPF